MTVIGGDQRNAYLAALLMQDGYDVEVYGFDRYHGTLPPQAKSLSTAVEAAECIIGPTPCSHNGIALQMSYSEELILLDTLFSHMHPQQPFYAGHISAPVLTQAKARDIICVDLLKQEELACLNAIPTAEGAIKIAIENTDFTLHGAQVLVMGYGRIGKMLCKMLHGIGATVHPLVFSPQESAVARSFGYQPLTLRQLNRRLPEMELIFNTVPSVLLDVSNLELIDRHTLLIDVASAPHGVDYSLAKEKGLTVLFTGSLPGITAPRSAAQYMKETILRLLEEQDDEA